MTLPAGADETLRTRLETLADALLPLSDWIATKAFVPEGTFPWRDMGALTAKSLGFADFFEGLLRETTSDRDLAVLWDAAARDPLGRCPIPNVAGWRAARGLSAAPRFSAALTDNVLVDTEIREISRADFYAPFWPVVSAAFEAAEEEGTPIASEATAVGAQLLAGTYRHWQGEGAIGSKRFCGQFVKDVLYAHLGLRNPVAAPFADAVLVELGERRRVGNKYTPVEAEAAVELMKDRLARALTDPHAHLESRSVSRPFVSPAGSPPVNARECFGGRP